MECTEELARRQPEFLAKTDYEIDTETRRWAFAVEGSLRRHGMLF